MQSLIHPKKQDYKKSIGGGDWRQQERGVGQNLKKRGVGGVFIKQEPSANYGDTIIDLLFTNVFGPSYNIN